MTHAPGARLARVIADGASAKAGHVTAAGPDEARVRGLPGGRAAVGDAGGPRARLGGSGAVAEAERCHTERYGRTPPPNPCRAVIEIALTGELGNG